LVVSSFQPQVEDFAILRYSVLEDALGLLPKQILGKSVYTHCMAIPAPSRMTGITTIVYASVCKYRKVVWVKFR
jgi:hypothetical protein